MVSTHPSNIKGATLMIVDGATELLHKLIERACAPMCGFGN
jgi:hypothetical protein